MIKRSLSLSFPLLLCGCALLPSHPIPAACYKPPPPDPALLKVPTYQQQLHDILTQSMSENP